MHHRPWHVDVSHIINYTSRTSRMQPHNNILHHLCWSDNVIVPCEVHTWQHRCAITSAPDNNTMNHPNLLFQSSEMHSHWSQLWSTTQHNVWLVYLCDMWKRVVCLTQSTVGCPTRFHSILVVIKHISGEHTSILYCGYVWWYGWIANLIQHNKLHWANNTRVLTHIVNNPCCEHTSRQQQLCCDGSHRYQLCDVRGSGGQAQYRN